jgi:hypothetical protein
MRLQQLALELLDFFGQLIALGSGLIQLSIGADC